MSYFYKDPKIKYTDMAIFIDEKIANGDIDENDEAKIYEYLYHLIFMLSHKQKFFNQSHYYEDFAITLASDVMTRLLYNPKLEETLDDGTPRMKPIKSILNYLKSIIYGRKVEYEKMNYSQKFVAEDEPMQSLPLQQNRNREQLQSEVKHYFSTVSNTVKRHVYKNSPYKNDSVLIKHIYQSCLLSILNSLIFTYKDLYSMENNTYYSLPDSRYKYVCRMYEKNKEGSIILYGLGEEYRSYITVLVRQIGNLIKEDFKEIVDSHIPFEDDILMDMAYFELSGKTDYEH